MATIKDVAQRAGVNISTVSRFLAGQLRIKEDTRLKILQVKNWATDLTL
ncbi:MAG: LacI family DNA-binding transcriptional regulator [Firmicutes bacterium]|nr:LacI family DNA-binding transcriptional regulator [Bacillota bacterium]